VLSLIAGKMKKKFFEKKEKIELKITFFQFFSNKTQNEPK